MSNGAKVTPIQYSARGFCKDCKRAFLGTDARIATLTHTRETGHTTRLHVDATEEYTAVEQASNGT